MKAALFLLLSALIVVALSDAKKAGTRAKKLPKRDSAMILLETRKKCATGAKFLRGVCFTLEAHKTVLKTLSAAKDSATKGPDPKDSDPNVTCIEKELSSYKKCIENPKENMIHMS